MGVYAADWADDFDASFKKARSWGIISTPYASGLLI
jgi:hypothetical protein